MLFTPMFLFFPYTTLFRSHLSEPIQSYAAGTWVAGTADCAIVIAKYIPVFIVITHMMAVFALFRSEEHTSVLQSRGHIVCSLLHEKNKTIHAYVLIDITEI